MAHTVDIDSKINKIYGINFKKSFWDLGSFPAYYQNGTDQQKLLNPWVKSNSYAAPFDQCKLPLSFNLRRLVTDDQPST